MSCSTAKSAALKGLLETSRRQRRQKFFIDALADRSLVQQPLDAHVRVDAPPQYAAAVQIQKSVNEHFRAAVEAGFERRRVAD